MFIIGITGAIGHGKTSLSDAFLRQIPAARSSESSELIARVADELNKQYVISRPTADNNSAINAWLSNVPTILRNVAHYNGVVTPIHIAPTHNIKTDPDFQKLAEYLEQVQQNHSLVTQTITVGNKETYRALLQWIGGYTTKHVNPTLWYDELLREAGRAETEGCSLFLIGGVRFPSDAQAIHGAGGQIIAIERPDIHERDSADSTEAFRSMIPIDSTVINDAKLGALDHVVVNLWKDLQEDDLKSRYQSSRIIFGANHEPAVQEREML